MPAAYCRSTNIASMYLATSASHQNTGSHGKLRATKPTCPPVSVRTATMLGLSRNAAAGTPSAGWKGSSAAWSNKVGILILAMNRRELERW